VHPPQIDEQRNAVVEHAIGIGKGKVQFGFGALCLGWVWYRPERGHRMTRPDRTGFIRGAVAKREDEIHFRRVGLGKLVPAFRAGEARIVVEAFEQLQRVGIDLALRLRTGGKGLEPAGTEPIEDGFRHDDRAELALQRNSTL
jgi:hypothetical protein